MARLKKKLGCSYIGCQDGFLWEMVSSEAGRRTLQNTGTRCPQCNVNTPGEDERMRKSAKDMPNCKGRKGNLGNTDMGRTFGKSIL